MSDPQKNIIADSEIRVEGNLRIGDEYAISYNIQSSSSISFFEDINLEDRTSKGYQPPTFAPMLLERLEKNRILFLGGGYNFNKDGLMKFLASQAKSKDSSLDAKESMGLSGLNSLLHTLRKAENRTIFLIYKATPESFEYSFEEIKQVAAAGKHLILVSTDTPSESWHFTELERNYIWYEIHLKEAYYQDVLSKKIQQGLHERNLTIPDFFDLKKLVARLLTPESIDVFIDILASQPKITPESIENSLRSATSSDALGIAHWFHNLSSDHKLLAIGFTVFSGLREAQFFDSMDMLIQQGWEGRNHQLKPLDYNDVLPLLSYFTIENGYIRSKYPGQANKLLLTAWKTHRRFLDSALPVLEKLVVLSASDGTSNWRLFGSSWRRHIVRQVVTNTLTLMGEIDFSTVENSLLLLAANEDFEVRMVTAETLANLRPVMQDNWYKTIDLWQTNIEIQNVITDLKTLEKSKYDKNQQIPLNFIQATIAATLGAVAQRDSANNLDQRVLDQVKRLARVRNTLVTQSVQHTLRLLSARHTKQVAESLKEDFLRYATFIDPIAAGLADGYNNIDPVATRAVLFGWLEYINHNPTPRKNYTDLLHEDKVICCATLTFQLIDYQLTFSSGKITVEEAYQTLDFLRTISHQPKVRAYLLRAIVTLIEENLRNPSQGAINYISNLDTEERDHLVEGFNTKYLSQRADLLGGEYQLRIYDKVMPSWDIPADRPKTSVELLMKDWLGHPDKAISQIATMTFLKIGALEERERQKIDEYVEEQQRLSQLQEVAEVEIPEHQSAIEANAFTRIFIKVATQITLPHHAQKLQNIAPVLMQTSTVSDAQLVKLLANFDDVTSEQDKIVLQLVYLYNLFKGKDLDFKSNPFKSDFWASMMYSTSSASIPVFARNHFAGWVPILIQNPKIDANDVGLILSSVGSWGNPLKSKVMLFRFLYRNNWVWFVLVIIIAYLLAK